MPRGGPVLRGGADAAKVFLVMALASGLDVLALQRMYRCSYASVGHEAGRGGAAPAVSGGPVREHGEGRPCRLEAAYLPKRHGGEEDQGHGQSSLLHHPWGEGWRSPVG